DIAVARQLGAQAELMRTQQPDRLPLALLLSTESLRLQPHAVETQLTLRSMLRAFPRPQAVLPQAGMVTHIAFSSDGALMAAAAGPAGSLWRVDGLKHIAALPGADHRVTFSPDGRRVAGCCHEVGVWSASGERELALGSDALRGEPRQIAFSPDGQRLAIGLRAQNPGFVVYDLATKQPIARYSIELSGDASAMAFGADGSLYFAPREVIEIHSGGGEPVSGKLEPGLGGIQWLAIDPRGQTLAASSQRRVAVFDLSSPGTPTRLEASSAGPGNIAELAFDATGEHLAAVGELDTGTVWRKGSWKPVLRVTHQEFQTIASLAFDATSPRAVSCATDGNCFGWSLRSGERQQRFAHVYAHTDAPSQARQMLSAAFAPGRPLLATGGADRTLRLWELPPAGAADSQACAGDGYRIGTFGPDTPGWVRSGDGFEPGSRGCRPLPGKVSEAITVTAHGAFDVATLPVDKVSLLERASGKTLALLAHDDPVDWDSVQERLQAQGMTSMRAYLPAIERMKTRGSVHVEAVSASGLRIATYRDADLKLRVWDTRSQRVAYEERIQGGSPRWLHFLSDTQLLRLDRDGRLSLQRMPEGTPLWASDGGDILALALSADASRLAWVVQRPEPQLRVLEVTHGRLVFERRLGRPAGELLFAPNGRHLVVLDGTDSVPEGLPLGVGLTLWDLASGRTLVDLAKSEQIVAFSFSNDGGRFAAVGRGGLLRVWSLVDGAVIAKAVAADPGPLAFSANGQWLAAGHGSVSVFDAGSLQLLSQIDLGGEIRQIEFRSGDQLLAVKRFEGPTDTGVLELHPWREEDLRAEACRRMPADAAKQWQQLFPGQPVPQACPPARP
ncbi:MAG TPA: WD40 repeat domain-containing protein, partial [Ideonella sp.]|nr:WD40 repeat domain-containing protein [Ideonella sp.]